MSQDITKIDNKALTLSERLALARGSGDKVLCLDISGSMCTDVEPGKSRLEALKDIVKAIPGNPTCYWFSDTWGKCTKDTIPNSACNTVLSGLLTHLKGIGVKEVVVITDGDINSWDQAPTLICAESMNVKIMYVGSGTRPAFLDKLAAVSGGMATSDDLKEQKALTSKLTLLLAPAVDDASNPRKGGSIQL